MVWKPSTTASNCPNSPRVNMRLCKHGENAVLLNYFIEVNKINNKFVKAS